MTIYTPIISAISQEHNQNYKNSLTISEYVKKIESHYSKDGFTVIGMMLPFKGNKTKLHMRCKKHGDWFGSNINNLLGNNRGCPICGEKRKLWWQIDVRINSRGNFKKRANDIHQNKYSYDKFFYKDNKSKSIIICKSHGEFLQSADKHLAGRGCPKCKILKISNARRTTLEDFIINANIVHNNKYDYSEFQYINSKTKGIIKCPDHGTFLQDGDHHLGGRGCPACAKYGYNDELDGYIYVCTLFDKNTGFEYTGYGKSNYPQQRFNCHFLSAKKKSYGIRNILIFNTIDGKSASLLESSIDSLFPHINSTVVDGFLEENSFLDQYYKIKEYIESSQLVKTRYRFS